MLDEAVTSALEGGAVALETFLNAGLARGMAGTILPLLGPVGAFLLGNDECSVEVGAASAEATSGFVSTGGRGASEFVAEMSVVDGSEAFNGGPAFEIAAEGGASRPFACFASVGDCTEVSNSCGGKPAESCPGAF